MKQLKFLFLLDGYAILWYLRCQSNKGDSPVKHVFKRGKNGFSTVRRHMKK
jgi:hypothetical protein